MSPTSEQFLAEVAPAWRRLYIEQSRGEWEVATTGTPEANDRLTRSQISLQRYFANPVRYSTARRLSEAGDADSDVARALKLVYLEHARNQTDDAAIQTLTELEAKVRDAYINFRAQYKGQSVGDNELDDVLANSQSSDDVGEAWEASKQIGPQVAETVREMARVRNRIARTAGFRDHFAKALTLDEIDEGELLALFDRLDTATAEPFATVKAEIDRRRAEWFDISPAGLHPWHYGDRFFQSAPKLGGLDMDRFFAGEDLVELALKTYDSMGLDTRDILARSDLYARPGKDQHAFCIDIDREGDVRTLNNLQPNQRWADTLLHELGHAVYGKYLDMTQPWVLRSPPHLLSTEAIALMMGGLTYDTQWLTDILGLAASEAGEVAKQMRTKERFAKLIFTRWVLVMTHFERALYGNPDSDLDTRWWDLAEKYQLLRRPEGRNLPDWAAKIHIALYPVYYHNYELGYLTAAQLLKTIDREAGGLVGRPKAGQWLIEKWFRPGAREDWAVHIHTATGEALNPDYFVQALI